MALVYFEGNFGTFNNVDVFIIIKKHVLGLAKETSITEIIKPFGSYRGFKHTCTQEHSCMPVHTPTHNVL